MILKSDLRMELRMITEDDISQAEEKNKLLAESYLKGIMDFIKWTSVSIPK